MIYKLIITGFFLLTLSNCSAQKTSTKKSKKQKSAKVENRSSSETTSKDIYIFKEGENRFLKEFETNVTFIKAIEDSRCPKGTNCIWEGNAKILLELMSTYSRPMKVELSTVNNPSKDMINSFAFNGYNYQLTSLDPYPTDSQGFQQNTGKYKIGLKITKISAETQSSTNFK